MAVLHFTHKMWPKDWFSSVRNGLVLKKRLQFTYIYRTYVRTFQQEEKNVEGFELTETALPEVQTWTANGKRDLWSLVTRLLHVCSHTYSETNVDLKFPHSARNDLRIIRDTKKRITQFKKYEILSILNCVLPHARAEIFRPQVNRILLKDKLLLQHFMTIIVEYYATATGCPVKEFPCLSSVACGPAVNE